MGFKLKKKNTDGSSNRSGGNALVAKLQSTVTFSVYLVICLCHYFGCGILFLTASIQ
jgi:hypothetical protein